MLAAPALLLAAGLSGSERDDPRTPAALPGMPPPFLGQVVVGSGGPLVEIDAYGSISQIRAPGPAGRGLVDNTHRRQRAGSVARDTGIVVRAGTGDLEPPWRAHRIDQGLVGRTGLVRTIVEAEGTSLRSLDGVHPTRPAFARRLTAIRKGERSAAPLVLEATIALDPGGSGRTSARRAGVSIAGSHAEARCEARPKPEVSLHGAVARLRWSVAGPRLDAELRCAIGGPGASQKPKWSSGILRGAAAADRAWLQRSRSLSADAPGWAQRLHGRSLLVLRALTDRRTGAAVAGARDFWHHVWPRDAALVALALHSAGHSGHARRIAGFLEGLDPDAGARFRADGSPVRDGRAPAGDAIGWIAVATGRQPGPKARSRWRQRDDWWEDGPGDHLGNAIAAGVPTAKVRERFAGPGGLRRVPGGRGIDSSAAWAVSPFRRTSLHTDVHRSLRTLSARAGPYGITPGTGWRASDPWTAPTAWSAWAFAELGDRAAADRLLAALRRSTTPAGLLPERVDARTGLPRSTTPLAWSHAAAVLALRARYGPR